MGGKTQFAELNVPVIEIKDPALKNNENPGSSRGPESCICTSDSYNKA